MILISYHMPAEPRILAETPKWIALDKPSGWLTIPGQGLPDVPVVSEWALSRWPERLIVHRLDRDTSGVLLLARGPEAHKQANAWFRDHRVIKFYECLATGRADAPVVRVNHPVRGTPALSQVERVEQYRNAFLARVRPMTGRRHQIRIHLGWQAHPLCGDPEYGGPRELALPSGELLLFPRVALHARRLELPSGEQFQAPWPEDFAHWVSRLREEDRDA
jgi:23S rRNA-/tRNA-specific pseudouridylate synthase